MANDEESNTVSADDGTAQQRKESTDALELSANSPTVEEGSAVEKPLTKLPSHATLAIGNYPPLWTPGYNARPLARPQSTEHKQSVGVPASTIQAVLKTSSSSLDKKPETKFKEQDSSNPHEYLQKPDRSYTHPRLNVFGRDVGPLGQPPRIGLGGTRRKKGT